MDRDNEYDRFKKRVQKIIKEVLYSKELSESKITFLNSFLDEYYELKDKQQNGEYSDFMEYELQLYEQLFNEINKSYDNFNPEEYPAFKIISEKEDAYYQSLENKFAKVRKLEINNKNNYGFATVVLIVGATVALGIALGALLWYIK